MAICRSVTALIHCVCTEPRRHELSEARIWRQKLVVKTAQIWLKVFDARVMWLYIAKVSRMYCVYKDTSVDVAYGVI